jgi:AcrR family transcriptional regulator
MTTKNEKSNIKGEKKTKERIFEAAIDLFAQKGFNATSMREIAEAVGIKKASMYSHYKSKDEILEKILEYPIGRMGSTGPQNIETEDLIVSMGLEKFMALAGDLIFGWMEGPYMEKIWRIICIELYHNETVKKFYSEFEAISCSYWISAFETMIKRKLIKPSNPRTLALEFLSFYGNAYMDYFLLNYGNTSGSFREKYNDLSNEHINFIVNSIRPNREKRDK